MTRRPRRRIRAALPAAAVWGALLVTLGGTPAAADRDFDLAKKLREAGEIVPFARVVENSRKFHPGHVIVVKFEEAGGRYIYEFEVLDPEGVVWALIFDARTGELIETLEESEEIRREEQE